LDVHSIVASLAQLMRVMNANLGSWLDDVEECAKELRRRNCATPPVARVEQTIAALRSAGYDVFPFAEQVIACFLGKSLRSEFDPDSGTHNPRIFDFEPSGICDESERENVADWEHRLGISLVPIGCGMGMDVMLVGSDGQFYLSWSGALYLFAQSARGMLDEILFKRSFPTLIAQSDFGPG
jgi:hypothetical protein